MYILMINQVNNRIGDDGVKILASTQNLPCLDKLDIGMLTNKLESNKVT